MNEEQQIKELHTLYGQVEHRLKIIETRAICRLHIPSVNQLRYAGRHLLDYLVNHQEYDLIEVGIHCKRALYDAYEIECIFYLKDFTQFRDDFRDMVITEIAPDYIEWEQAHRKIEEFIENNNHSENRYVYYKQLVPYVDELYKIHAKLPLVINELNKKRKIIRFSMIFGIIGILSLIFTGLAWLWPDPRKDSNLSLSNQRPSVQQPFKQN